MTSGGYVGLSLAVLLAQHHQVTALDIVPEKVEMINNKKSPIRDEYIEKYLAEKELDLTATLDAKEAYSDADFVVIALMLGEEVEITFCDVQGTKKTYKFTEVEGLIPFPSKPRFYCVTNPTKGVMKLWQFSAWKRTKVIRL